MPGSLAFFKDQLANVNSSQIQSKAQKLKQKHVILCQDLLSSRRKLPCFSQKLPCFEEKFSAHWKTLSSFAYSPPFSKAYRRKRWDQDLFLRPAHGRGMLCDL